MDGARGFFATLASRGREPRLGDARAASALFSDVQTRAGTPHAGACRQGVRAESRPQGRARSDG